MAEKLDNTDIAILGALQRNAGLSQREVAETVGLSQNACWRRIKRLEEAGVIKGSALRIDREAVGLDLVAFVLIRTRNHSREWLNGFRRRIEALAEVSDFYRIGGNFDYMLKVVTGGIGEFDAVYQRLIEESELDSVTSYFAMEAIVENRPLAIEPKERKNG